MTNRTGRTIYVALQSFTVAHGKETINVVGGRTRVREGHWLLQDDRMQFFEPLTVDYEVEDASAAPGAKRGA